MLIEPTESESKAELDRFCDAMLKIREEVEEISTGKQPKDNNTIKNAPHPVDVMMLSDADWNRPYSREKAAYALPSLRKTKFWPSVTRIDDGKRIFLLPVTIEKKLIITLILHFSLR